jgi:predicted DNA-binding transcriptional regulator AlpA
MSSDPATLPMPDPAQQAKPLLLSQADAWTYLGLPRSTWFRLRSAGKLPEPVAVPGGALYWRRADLDKWTSNLRPSRKKRRVGPLTKSSSEADLNHLPE